METLTYAQASELFVTAMKQLEDSKPKAEAWDIVAPVIAKLIRVMYGERTDNEEQVGLEQFKVDATVWLDKFQGESNE